MIEAEMDERESTRRVLVACPDARPPAYQAVIGVDRAGLLGGFLTSTYYDPHRRWPSLARQVAPGGFARLERVLLRRHDPEIPRASVRMIPSFDMALQLEARLGKDRPRLARALARWRTERFDARLARHVERLRPDAVLLFSDVGSRRTLPLLRRLGIPSILSMVHGDVRDEQRVLETEAAMSPEFMPIYLGGGCLDRDQLNWIFDRRLRDLELADSVLVPSQHIARSLVRQGQSAENVCVIPYAADCRRFQPMADKCHGPGCTFLFAGGISQRKGIKYLLEAWRKVRRPGWRLQLLGPMPEETGPLEPYLDLVEPLGRVSHTAVPERLAAADVFVFPSLFEGSAVVTYEALACGLPSVVTPSAGSVVRDGIEGFVVPERDVDSLAERMESLGNDRDLRARMSVAARSRALRFDWPRYHDAVVAVVNNILGREHESAHGRAVGSGDRGQLVSCEATG
jgi:glycosyltransferase involved in cell wall biosynthesis